MCLCCCGFNDYLQPEQQPLLLLLLLCRPHFDVSTIRVKRRMKWIAIWTSGSYVLDDSN